MWGQREECGDKGRSVREGVWGPREECEGGSVGTKG